MRPIKIATLDGDIVDFETAHHETKTPVPRLVPFQSDAVTTG